MKLEEIFSPENDILNSADLAKIADFEEHAAKVFIFYPHEQKTYATEQIH